MEKKVEKSEWHQAKVIRTTTRVVQGGADVLGQLGQTGQQGQLGQRAGDRGGGSQDQGQDQGQGPQVQGRGGGIRTRGH